MFRGFSYIRILNKLRGGLVVCEHAEWFRGEHAERYRPFHIDPPRIVVHTETEHGIPVVGVFN